MYIKSVNISNYRSLKEDNYQISFAIPDGTDGSGLTVLVGPNNVGKSNVFHALDFLFNKSGGDNTRNKQREEDDCVVTVDLIEDDLEGSINEYVQDNKKEPFKALIYQKLGKETFSLQRVVSDKIQYLDIWDEKGSKYKNVAGIDGPIVNWITFLPLWANTSTEEVATYSAKSVINKLLVKIVEEIQSHQDYVELHRQFEKIFGGDESSVLSTKTGAISAEVSGLIKEQFADVGIKFIADPPQIESYIKQIRTMVDDGDETDISDKGNGLQRAIMIALIQVYANSLNKPGKVKKPFFLFIDEPELYLNPQSQKVLLKSLRKIASIEQVFLVTHSPYFIDWQDYDNGAKIGRAKKENKSTVVKWLNNPSDYSSLLSEHIHRWSRPHLLDTVAKELMFADRILLLEGQEDVGLIRKWISDEQLDIKFDIFGYGVDGFGNYASYIKMATDLGVDKVAVIYDAGINEKAKMVKDQQINPAYKLEQLLANDIRDKFDSCNACKECLAKQFSKCTAKNQRKTGCFDESGTAKLKSNEYADFSKKFTTLQIYLET